MVIDSQASRRQQGGPANQPQRRPRRGRRRRGTYDETIAPIDTAAMEATDLVRVNSGSTVKDVAEYLGAPVPEVIKKLMMLGEMATLTQTLSDDAIQVLADEFEKKIEIVHAADDVEVEPVFEDAEEDLIERPPVVTIMGHVDHGKTSLLDAIRETEVAAGEAGGITQHIGAYQVHHGGKEITFLDTPGHEAFTAMRARGARVTDLAVIVVAADDGVKPQTEEAIDHAKAAEVPIVVAVNKIDKEGAQPERVRTEMTQHGLQPAEWGGEIEFVDVSAKTRQGLDSLLDTIQVVTDLEELKANSDAPASGTVIESKLDPGRGPVVSVLIQRGTLNVGDALVAGAHFGRVRAMHDFTGARVKHATPGQPVEVLGFDGVPEAGELVRVVENERRARQLAGERANRLKTEALARRSGRKVSLEDVFKLAQEGAVKELGLVVKADVAGSLEAIEDEIAKLPQEEVNVNIIHRGVGGINESDVMLAAASQRSDPRLQRASRRRSPPGGRARGRGDPLLLGDLPRDRGAARGDAGHARADRGRDAARPGRGPPAVPRVADRHDRRLVRDRGQGHARREGAGRARGDRHLRHDHREPAPLQRGRARGRLRIRVRDRARQLPGPARGRHPRDLRDAPAGAPAELRQPMVYADPDHGRLLVQTAVVRLSPRDGRRIG